MERIRIHSRRTVHHDGNLRVRFSVDGLDRDDGVDRNELWFEVNDRFADFVDDSFDAAAVALLVPAMMAGIRLDVEGPMSARLKWNLNHHVVPLVKLAHPDLHETDVTAAGRGEGPSPAGGVVMTPLSNGVDSFAAIIEHTSEDIPVEMRLTHLVFHTGAEYFQDDRMRRHFSTRYQRAQSTAAEIGLPLVGVLSNVGDFNRQRHGKYQGIKHSTVPLLLQGRVESWFYASTYPYSGVKAAPARVDSTDALLLPLLSTETTRLASTGSQYSRVEKTALVAEYPIAWDHLDVCQNSGMENGRNCSACSKCLRTFLTLELLGRLDRFGDVFDPESYQKARPAFVPRVIVSSDPFLAEIAPLMKTAGLRTTPRMWREALGQATTRSRRSPVRLARRALDLRRSGELASTILRRLRSGS